jgi:hypothetical protein
MLNELPASLLVSDSVIRVAGCPRVFGLQLDSHSSVTTQQSGSTSSLIDGGANICVTGDLSIMVGIVDIPLLPITVAIKDSDTSVDDCCTKCGFIPLTLLDRSIHWQIIFCCVNAAETIISPKAILASSNVFVSWMMTGFKDSRPSSLRFDSHDGFLDMALALVCRDGLYYCPADVFTINHSPVRINTFQVPAVATVLRVIGKRPQSIR